MRATPDPEKEVEVDLYTTAGQPYNVQQLQSEFHAISPAEAYAELCQRHQCHPIRAVAAMFSSVVGNWNATTTLNFSRLYVGPKGIRPVVEMCKRIPALASLNCANNYLTNDSVYFITRMAMFHPALERIELACNEFISWTGGTYLTELVVRNANIKEVGTRSTAIPTRVAEAVFEQTRRNCVLAAQASGRMPKPPTHPAVIHLRTLKRFFMERQENGTVPASVLADGFRERLRILGQERDIDNYTDDFYEKLRRGLPQDRIPWEAFVITLRMDGSLYDADLVKKIQRVFLEFNLEPAAGVEGFVEVRELAAMFARLYGEPPTPLERVNMYSYLGLDDTMTLRFDEFLPLMYVRGPKEKTLASGWQLTPLHPPTMFHF
ncbi:putative calpain-like cysteine peptidase [Trypanosoma conorhini]|uniref:Putative calpain-like cysteine peptidase n=1 Tax=Trypanosoma conorhini TaxID=83891 RepID=A0A3S5IUI4_9TRYP|nr:putative calpain-like cysteine peptidase [Trypanosoma conorhini]RNF26031.1 putative calpain-like cysteine peptidase [Trypanosoma conorhini]